LRRNASNILDINKRWSDDLSWRGEPCSESEGRWFGMDVASFEVITNRGRTDETII